MSGEFPPPHQRVHIATDQDRGRQTENETNNSSKKKCSPATQRCTHRGNSRKDESEKKKIVKSEKKKQAQPNRPKKIKTTNKMALIGRKAKAPTQREAHAHTTKYTEKSSITTKKKRPYASRHADEHAETTVEGTTQNVS